MFKQNITIKSVEGYKEKIKKDLQITKKWYYYPEIIMKLILLTIIDILLIQIF